MCRGREAESAVAAEAAGAQLQPQRADAAEARLRPQRVDEAEACLRPQRADAAEAQPRRMRQRRPAPAMKGVAAEGAGMLHP